MVTHQIAEVAVEEGAVTAEEVEEGAVMGVEEVVVVVVVVGVEVGVKGSSIDFLYTSGM